METIISASFLSADMLHLADELRRAKESNVDMVHYDVMDGVFVPNISFGIPVLKAISKDTDLFIDVHLMIENPQLYVMNFVEAGADMITFHLESKSDPFRTIEAIHEKGIKAGIAIKPKTPAKAILPFLDEVENILVMTVEPGFGGQGYIHEMTPKIQEVRQMIGNRKIYLQVDGGINDETAQIAQNAGANLLVAGSYLFSAPDMLNAVEGLRKREAKP
ncbi:MAG: ribulose-phosphate 3-epimerase [Oscillospiraceae bacterium]